MIRKNLKSTAGLTLIEILIGIVVSSIMMAAIYTTAVDFKFFLIIV